MNYQPAKPDVTRSNLVNALLSGSPPALLHQGEAAGEKSAALHADMPSTPLRGDAGEGDSRAMWGKCTSLGHGNVKG